MRWTPGGMSDDVEDRRSESGGGSGGRGIGLGGLLILVVISLITGRNYIGSFLANSDATQVQSGPATPRQISPDENRSAQLVSFVLDDAQNTWTKILAAKGIDYPHAKLVLFRDATRSGCGEADARTGPFYCPADERVYIDLGFWDELKRFGGSGEFAQAYVVAHEIGHHVQDVLGTEQKVRQAQQSNPSARNQLSVAMELQADCYAGVWAHSTEQRNIIDQADIESGLQAAAAVGDDHIQKMEAGHVSPESFTHGSSAQRVSWFKQGMEQGDIAACNTFNSSANE